MKFISLYETKTKVKVSGHTFLITKVAFTEIGQVYTLGRVDGEGKYQELFLYEYEIDTFLSEKQIYKLYKPKKGA